MRVCMCAVVGCACVREWMVGGWVGVWVCARVCVYICLFLCVLRDRHASFNSNACGRLIPSQHPIHNGYIHTNSRTPQLHTQVVDRADE